MNVRATLFHTIKCMHTLAIKLQKEQKSTMTQAHLLKLLKLCAINRLKFSIKAHWKNLPVVAFLQNDTMLLPACFGILSR